MKDLETVISKQSMLTLAFLPIHCALRFVFFIYTKETFELLAFTCILVSLSLWLGKSRFLFAKTLCHIYVGVFPVLMLIVIPSNLILAGCMNFLSLMFMTIVEDNTASLLVLVLSNSIAWTAFSFWERSPLEKYRETQMYARSTDISFASQFFACVIISYIVLAMIALEKSRNNAQRLRYEMELLRLKGELDETKTRFTKSNEDLKNALNEKENFILRFSHEIRNPLNSLLGNVELLTEIAVEDKTLEMLRDARVRGEVLLQLVNNVLDTAKIAARQLEVSIGTFSVREFMEKTWVICGEIIRKKGLIGTLSLAFSTPEYLDFDKHRLMQIMINMVSNATKFTDKGYVRMYTEFLPGDCIDPIDMKPKHLSRVGFSFSEFFVSPEEYQNSRELDERENYLFDTLTPASKRFVRGNSLNSISNKLRLSYSKESRNHEIPGYLRIEIIDSGCGMTAEQTSSLFKKFGQVNAQANKRQVGTGLGLWITKELVEIMNGKIEVYSAANIGTCFVIMIKSHSRSLCTQIKRSTNDYNLKKHNPRGAINCIVVEAITYNQEITRKFLQKCQVNNVFVVSNGKEAIHLFNSKPQQFFSFIIIDLDITLVNGKTACQMIRNHERDLGWKPCKIIAHAACSDSLTKTQLLDVHGACKADAVLSKPVSFDTIVKTLKELGILDKDDEIPANRLSSRRSFNEKNKKVLIAEDDVFNLDLMQKMLNSLGLESIVACNGAEAIKAFEKNRKEIQLVLMDCEMPLLDGFEATRQIAKMIGDSFTKSRIPIFGLSGHSGRIYEKKAKESGMKMLITKPISMNQLRNILKAENIIH